MARKCSTPGCAFSLPDKYPLEKCPWHLAPGKGPVKIAAAITIAAAGFGGGIAYRKFRAYLRNRNKQRQKKAAFVPEKQKATTAAGKPAVAKSQKQPRIRKRSASKPKRQSKKRNSEIET
jgi:hypothetical protein